MRLRLLPYLNGTAVILLNLLGIIVFYDALRDFFIYISPPEFITLSTVLALRISFCLLIHRALVDTGPSKYVQIGAAAGIAALPAVRGISVTPPVLVPSLIQLLSDLLIVILTLSAHKQKMPRRHAERISWQASQPASDGLRDFLDTYCVEELNSLYAYLPMPHHTEDTDALHMLERLQTHGVVVGKHYRIRGHWASEAAKRKLPHMFQRDPMAFDVYRIDQKRLREVLA